jgi:hypothetical protein
MWNSSPSYLGGTAATSFGFSVSQSLGDQQNNPKEK